VLPIKVKVEATSMEAGSVKMKATSKRPAFLWLAFVLVRDSFLSGDSNPGDVGLNNGS
jgi:hypothetical protein